MLSLLIIIFIKGFKKPSQFIATQGPMGNTVNEFWEMIWDNDVNTIVMLTELEEKDIVSQRITVCFYHY